MEHSQARERVLEAAALLFAQRGYESVTIKDIARQAGIHHASLYHHAPGGKEDLYVEVTERTLQRHEDGIASAIRAGQGSVRAQLMGIAAWLLAQPPMDMIRMVHSDMPAINPGTATRLLTTAHEVMLVPIVLLLEEAQARGEIAHPNLANVGGAIFSAIEGLHTLPEAFLERPRHEMANELIDVFLAGLRPR